MLFSAALLVLLLIMAWRALVLGMNLLRGSLGLYGASERKRAQRIEWRNQLAGGIVALVMHPETQASLSIDDDDDDDSGFPS